MVSENPRSVLIVIVVVLSVVLAMAALSQLYLSRSSCVTPNGINFILLLSNSTFTLLELFKPLEQNGLAIPRATQYTIKMMNLRPKMRESFKTWIEELQLEYKLVHEYEEHAPHCAYILVHRRLIYF